MSNAFAGPYWVLDIGKYDDGSYKWAVVSGGQPRELQPQQLDMNASPAKEEYNSRLAQTLMNTGNSGVSGSKVLAFKNKAPKIAKVVSVKRIVGPEATGETCDMGLSSTDNAPNDVSIELSNTIGDYNYADNATFTCDGTGCVP